MREELIKQIENIKKQLFFNEMNDHWLNEDFEFDRKKTAELRELEAQLKELEESENEV